MEKDSDSDTEDDQWSHIQKSDVKPGMFVSGWEEDPNNEVDEDTNPHGMGKIPIYTRPLYSSPIAATPGRSLLWACNEGRNDLAVSLLRQHGAGIVHASDADGYTPLHRASYNNNVPLVKLLLAHDADPNATTAFGWTPVHSACQWTHAEVVAVLLQHGADVNARTDGGTKFVIEKLNVIHITCLITAPQIKRHSILLRPCRIVGRPPSRCLVDQTFNQIG